MCFDNRCGCRRRRGCGICEIFRCFGGGRRRCGCDFDFRGDSCGDFDNDFGIFPETRRIERALTRADFDGFFPEAKFVKSRRNCGCR